MHDFNNRKDLIEYSKTKDINLRNKIALNNYKLIYLVLNKFYIPGIHDIEELEQECFIILLKAIENFDISYGAKFSTYAIACLKSIAQNKIDYNQEISLNNPVPGADGEEIELMDTIEDKDSVDMDDYCFDLEMEKKLKNILNYEEYTTLKSLYVRQIKHKDLQKKLNKTYWQIDLIRRTALRKLENNPYFKEYKKDFMANNEISYLSAYDYSRPKIQTSDISSPTLEIVLQKERQETRLYKDFLRDL